MRQGRALRILVLFTLPSSALASADGSSPELVRGSVSLKKTTLSISYNPEHKQADWVFYPLGKNELQNCVQRTDRFRPDPMLTARDTAQLSDYQGSGFDRGHLSPAADNKWSMRAMHDSFLLSNISPQPPRFNQGIWGKLENLVRAWALKTGDLWVTTGPLLERGLPSIGAGEVSTPRYFYKVLVTQTAKARKALALLLPVNASGDLSQYAVTIDELEERTGLDFNHGMDREAEAELESTLSVSAWDFDASYKAPACRRAPSFNFSFSAAAGFLD